MKFKKLLLVMPAFLIAGTLVGCGESSNVLSVSNLETSYYVGDKLDTSKVKVYSVDSSGKATEVAATNLEFTNTDFTTAGEHTVTVKDKNSGLKGAFTVNVLKDNEVDAERYGYAIYDFLHANVKAEIDYTSTYTSSSSSEPSTYNYKYEYKRNGNQEMSSVIDEDYVRYMYYNQGNYYYVTPAKKETSDTFVVNKYSTSSSSLFDSVCGINRNPLWYFDSFTLKDNAYTLTYETGSSSYKTEYTYALSFNRGKLTKLDYTNKQTSKSETYSSERTTTYSFSMDYSFSEQIFTEPEELDIYHASVSSFSKTEEKKYVAKISNFTKYNDEGSIVSADDSEFIDVGNVTCRIQQSKDGEYVTVDVPLKCELGKDKEGAKEITCTLDFGDISNGGQYQYYLSFLGVGSQSGTITIE